MNAFSNAVEKDINKENKKARTANGMRARKNTGNMVLDYFSKAGSARGTNLSKEFMGALADNEDLAVRALLWTRDVRGGAGERRQFRDQLQTLEKENSALARRIMAKIPVVGRWDDLFAYQNPLNRESALQMYADAIRAGDGLAAKWAPREKGTKSKIAAELRKTLGMTPKQYRKTLVELTKVVETQMCAKNWNEINFSHVPSLAAARYQKAFMRNAGVEYTKYIQELQKPQAERDPNVKINASAVYPYDVLKSVTKGEAAVANEQWNALPNYVGDAKILPMVDVSGSMGWFGGRGPLQPIDYAISLGLYCSEKNTGPYKDIFLTFSEKPEFVKVKGTVSQRMAQMSKAAWGMNTNLHAAFDKILGVATKNKVSQKDMPEVLLILSDMQFDHCARFDDSAIKMIKRKYADAGYKVPRIVFWNLNAAYGRDNTPVKFDKNGTALVSGFSPAIMKSVLADDLEEFTPMNVMLQTLQVERYDY